MGPATTLRQIHDRAVEIEVGGFSLEVIAGPDTGVAVRADKRSLAIGTHPAADLTLSDHHVSRLHARLDVAGADYVLRDVGSTNGTRIAGTRIREAFLEDGAVIELGATRIRFRCTEHGFTIPLAAEDAFEGLVGRSVAMRELFALLARVAPTDATAIVEGETGTGKELVARALHRRSARAERPFVVLDCGAVPPTLIESELFGHEKGAFTGATAQRAGVFERAHGGTVFLDELGELALELQPKLLRVLETGELTRVGGDRALTVDVRVVAATNRDLARMVAEGRFRADLYYRLAVIRLVVPPLRERREDIALLAAHFARDIVGGRAPLALATLEGVFGELSRHDWPGNVRELRNVVERAAILADPKLLRAGDAGAAGELTRSVVRAVAKDVTLRAARAEREREYLGDLLRTTDGDLDAAARIAGVHRKSLERFLRRHKLKR